MDGPRVESLNQRSNQSDIVYHNGSRSAVFMTEFKKEDAFPQPKLEFWMYAIC